MTTEATWTGTGRTVSGDPTSGICLRGSWYEIDLAAIRHNYRSLRHALPDHVRIYACLKRNGYGCGAVEMAHALAEDGADGFALASLADAIAMRRRGLDHPILLYPGPPLEAAPVIEALDLTVSVSNVAELQAWRGAMTRVRVFLKVDLGFFRAGATPAGAVPLLAAASAAPGVRIEGLYAHMSELPSTTPADAAAQRQRMQAILHAAAGLGVDLPLVMMSSTEGVLNHPDMDFGGVDPGALLVGLSETASPVRPIALRPALKAIVSRLVAIKQIDASLGPLPDLPGFHDGMILGVIAFGWGDGFPRQVPAGASALVRGRRVPILPPAHLEHLRLDLTGVPQARFGDPVILLGRQGDAEITLEEVATLWGTDALGLYASLRDHVPRLYT
jgi:alanine racemase